MKKRNKLQRKGSAKHRSSSSIGYLSKEIELSTQMEKYTRRSNLSHQLMTPLLSNIGHQGRRTFLSRRLAGSRRRGYG